MTTPPGERPPNLANPERDSWLHSTYYAALPEEIGNAHAAMHNAMNWGLTLLSGSLVAAVGRTSFPDPTALWIMFFTYLVGFHFYIRALKGYANVMRWVLIQHKLASNALGLGVEAEDCIQVINTYHLQWRLPLSRREIYKKGLLDLGFGYLLLVIIFLAVYVAICIKSVEAWKFLLFGILFTAWEVYRFNESVYMKDPAQHKEAQKLK